MHTVTPVIIPMSSESYRCPQCHAVEDIKRTCRHCGYEYAEGSGLDWRGWLVVIGAFVTVGWLIITILDWLGGGSSPYGQRDSLVEVLRGQWGWLKQIRLW